MNKFNLGVVLEARKALKLGKTVFIYNSQDWYFCYYIVISYKYKTVKCLTEGGDWHKPTFQDIAEKKIGFRILDKAPTFGEMPDLVKSFVL